MPIPDLERRRVTQVLDAFRAKRIPPDVRSQVDLRYAVDDNAVVLAERRPAFQRPGKFTETPVAKFRYLVGKDAWSLYYRDRNLKWHLYEGFEDMPLFQVLLDEVNADPTGLFWG